MEASARFDIVQEKLSGFATYYYDVENVRACNTSFENQNKGGVTCSTPLLTLNDLATNHVVAMNVTQLRANPSRYCGKKVIVYKNGRRFDFNLFIADGCERCSIGSASVDTWNPNGAPGLDFSLRILDQITGGEACHDGYAHIEFEILDETLHSFEGVLPTPIVLSSHSASALNQGTNLASSPAALATTTSPACPENNVWQCNGNVLEQCINLIWTPRAICRDGLTCQGNSRPYCGRGLFPSKR